MTRNFGLGSRDMGIAGKFALNDAVKNRSVSFSTAGTNHHRWHSFTIWAKANGVKKMEDVTRELVKKYGRELAQKVNTRDLSAATAQVYISAVNSVMSIATQRKWQSVSPTKDCNIPQRCAVRQDAPGALDRAACASAVEAVRVKLGDRVAAVVELARELGLRSKEASLLDARAALTQAREKESVTITSGTKGGRRREVPIASQEQVQALQRAAQAQGRDRSMIPIDQSWQKWRSKELREARDLVRQHTTGGLHDLRSAYACQRYQEKTGHAAPAASGVIADKSKDLDARKEISKELGHNRVEVVAEYIGGRR
ncbi:conserved hypothetical protein [Acidovorax delafieldii 2AN]|uniref:Integrase catalytic domain-containing protein n=1 Tax=Acidovorax delafieldii 2AN TaxID=573060 RepID=C5T0N1_ACIDE|nr:integrase domain-containing protein [Acidovorax delafieldii]EER61936.1 conserved hypothetical protein [Acidovorax delafieldii 2AN]